VDEGTPSLQNERILVFLLRKLACGLLV